MLDEKKGFPTKPTRTRLSIDHAHDRTGIAAMAATMSG
jgi:hypothetical protein